jgi:hypothetical protein
VDFSFSPWDEKSQASQEACRLMLEKNRHKRPSVEELMNLAWYEPFKKVNDRGQADGNNFKAYALTTPNSPKI